MILDKVPKDFKTIDKLESFVSEKLCSFAHNSKDTRSKDGKICTKAELWTDWVYYHKEFKYVTVLKAASGDNELNKYTCKVKLQGSDEQVEKELLAKDL